MSCDAASPHIQRRNYGDTRTLCGGRDGGQSAINDDNESDEGSLT